MQLKAKNYSLFTPSINIGGHWRFRGNLKDSSPNGNDLQGTTEIKDHYYEPGYADRGTTALDIAKTGVLLIPAASASDLDVGTGNFTVELIIKFHGSDNGLVLGKHDNFDKGYFMGTNAYGKLIFVIRDSVNPAQVMTDTDIYDGKYHHLMYTIDRRNDTMHIYIDGTEDVNSPASIAAVNNSISVPNDDFVISEDGYNQFVLDELCISKYVFNDSAAEARATGRIDIVTDYKEEFLLQHFPVINQNNSALKQFLVPFNTRIRDALYSANTISLLRDISKCPARFLVGLASDLGFELPEATYLSDQARRNLMLYAVWLYKRKGTKACVEKLCNLLGFDSTTINETFVSEVPMILNNNNFNQINDFAALGFYDDFELGTLDLWNAPNTSFDVVTIRLVGSNKVLYINAGTPGVGEANGLTFNDTAESFYIEAEIDVTTVSSSTDVGILLDYTDGDNYIRGNVRYTGSTYRLEVVRTTSGSDTVLYYVDGIEYKASVGGIFKLWFWVINEGTSVSITAGVEDETLYNDSLSTTYFSFTKKGVVSIDGCGANFYTVTMYALDEHGTSSVLYYSNIDTKEIAIVLDGTTDNKDAKFEYLKKVVPNYIPNGVTIDWTLIP